MQGAIDLAQSERGTFAMLLVVAVTVLAVIGVITGQQWMTFATWIAVTLIASKTLRE